VGGAVGVALGPMRRADVAATLFVTCVWGVAFVGIKKVLEGGPPLTLAGVRFVLGGLLLVPLLFRYRAAESGDTPGPPGAGRPPTWSEVAVVGLLQTTALYGCGFLGVQRTTAGAAALLLNTNPVMVSLLAVPLLGERLRPRAVIGIVAAVAGVALVSVRSGLGSPAGVALLLAGALAWAGGSIAVKRLEGVDLLRLSCGQMLAGGLPLLLAGVVAEHTLPHPTATSAAWFAFLVIPATAVNFVVWFGLLERYSAGAMTSWLFLIPLFGVLAGAVLLGEPVSSRVVAGGALIVAGLLLTQEQAAADEVVIGAA
jgi:drug/metabolite transporter (DMT)-like permease